jgi:hypothetical protein
MTRRKQLEGLVQSRRLHASILFLKNYFGSWVSDHRATAVSSPCLDTCVQLLRCCIHSTMTSVKIASITRTDLEGLEETAPSITDVKHLSSYNWIDWWLLIQYHEMNIVKGMDLNQGGCTSELGPAFLGGPQCPALSGYAECHFRLVRNIQYNAPSTTSAMTFCPFASLQVVMTRSSSNS